MSSRPRQKSFHRTDFTPLIQALAVPYYTPAASLLANENIFYGSSPLEPKDAYVVTAAKCHLERTLTSVQDGLHELELIRKFLLKKSEEVSKDLARHRTLLAPVRGLPVEILQEIFILCRDSVVDHQPVTAQVNKYWRHISLGTRELWTSASFSLFDGNPYLKIQHLTRQMKRSRGLPFTLSLTPPRFLASNPANHSRFRTRWDAVSSIAFAEAIVKYAHRLGSFTIANAFYPRHNLSKTILQTWLSHSVSAPLLKTLDIQDSGVSGPLVSPTRFQVLFLKNIDKLDVLRLHHPLYIIEPETHQILSDSLKYLQFQVITPARLSPSFLFGTTTRARLEILDITASTATTGSTGPFNVDHLELPRVSTLIAPAESLQTLSLSLPSLKHLILVNVTDDRFLSSFPAVIEDYGQQLTYLGLRPALTAGQPHLSSRTLQQCLSFTPNLRGLLIPPGCHEILGQYIFPHLTHLEVQLSLHRRFQTVESCVQPPLGLYSPLQRRAWPPNSTLTFVVDCPASMFGESVLSKVNMGAFRFDTPNLRLQQHPYLILPLQTMTFQMPFFRELGGIYEAVRDLPPVWLEY